MSKLFSETEYVVPDAVASDEIENIYFSLDLRIPKSLCAAKAPQSNQKHKNPVQLTLKGEFNNDLPKFGFIDRLEKIFEFDLRANNPWLNPQIKNNCVDERPKKVRISTLEIQSSAPELPYCRKDHPTSKPGQLHAPHCNNASQETVDVLGDHTYQNRQFILQDLERRIKELHIYTRESSPNKMMHSV